MKRGFTLIEILAVLVIVAILAGLAFARLQTSKDRAAVATMTSDLRAISEEQEAYYFINRIYTTDLVALNARLSPGNVLTIHEATTSGWAGSVANPRVSQQCYIVVGTATPVGSATADAGINCS
ncbi:MAG TPA: prepilin-type N-terminal cleavage/methylation domain-containing protein [Gemmatimonadales bacterium]|nr:prepilin-type N-terminal cleavage/methylation domain-containing protein [Gemmatimonadales bacterium]